MKNELVKYYGIAQTTQLIGNNYKYMGTYKHVKRTEAMERKNCCAEELSTQAQLISKAIDINFMHDILI